jgi:hypothetical protein
MKLSSLRLNSIVFLLPLLIAACTTPGKGFGQGGTVVTKSGGLEFAIARDADSKSAENTLKAAAYDICRTTTNQNFRIQLQEAKPLILLAKVDCVGEIDPFTSMKYGSRRKIQMQKSGEMPGAYRFSY